MNDEKTGSETISEDEIQSHRESKKRNTYPARSLKEIIDFVAKVYNQLGHTDYFSNKAIATVHGLSSDSIKQQLSAAQQYKLLEIKYGVGYKITSHFQKLYLPKSENERRTAAIESLKHAESYQQLFKDYEYHVVPSDGVKNHFIRSFGFKEDIAAKASQVFLENLKDFALIDGRGVLTSSLPLKPEITEVVDSTQTETNNTNNSGTNQDHGGNELPATRQRFEKFIFQNEIDAAGKKTIPIHLIGSKQALFLYPDDITEDDIELVKHQIDGILLRIKLEAKTRAAEAAK